MHGYKPWKIKWSFGFYTSHSVGFFIKRKKHVEVGNYNLDYLSSDLDFFYRMIINFKLKGMSTKKDEIFGHFSKGARGDETLRFEGVLPPPRASDRLRPCIP